MEYSTKEVAEMLGVSPQRVNQMIKNLNKEDKPNKVKGSYVFTDKNIKLLRNRNLNKQELVKSDLKSEIRHLQAELANKDEQLHRKDEQLDAALSNAKEQTKIASQAQQLHLQTMTELNNIKTELQKSNDKIKQLEAPKQEETSDTLNVESTDVEPIEEPKQENKQVLDNDEKDSRPGFFARFFNFKKNK